MREHQHGDRVKKIGLYLGARPEGGEFQYQLSLLDALSALNGDGHEVVCGAAGPEWRQHAAARGMRSLSAPSSFPGNAVSTFWIRAGLPVGAWRATAPFIFGTARALLAERCDLWIFPTPTARSFMAPVPALVSIHDLMHRYEPGFPESSGGAEYYCRERNLINICRWARGVLVDSETGKRQAVESYGVAPDKVHVLPFVAAPYIREAAVPDDFDARYPLPPKYLFYPAQFWEHKNHKRLIRAVASLKKELPDLALVLAGSPKNAFPSFQVLVRELGLTEDVHILGYVPDDYMPELYRRARALVMPTFYGPTNIPPLEAFACGCPVAISGIYAMPEQAGDAALFFDPKSVDDIAGCIRRLWSDDRLCADLAARGRERAAAWGQKQFNERLRCIVERVSGGHGQ